MAKQYILVKKGDWTKTDKFVTAKCPKCGGIGCFDHQISGTGHVHPSVICQNKGCNFHGYLQLEGWPE